MNFEWEMDPTVKHIQLFEKQFFRSLSRQEKSTLDPEQRTCIIAYLKNPTKVGIWELQAAWLPKNRLSDSVMQQIPNANRSRHVDKERESASRSGNPTATRVDKFIEDSRWKLSFVMEIFKYIKLRETSEDKAQEAIDAEPLLWLSRINVDELKKELSESYLYFVENIDCPDLSLHVRTQSMTRIKSGAFVLVEPTNRRRILKCVSLTPEPLENLRDFLSLLGKISEPRLRMIFSPEDEVFEPYFAFVREPGQVFNERSKLGALLAQGITEYQANRFSSCISALGLMAEECLTQIYETLFREVAPKGKTLGQMIDFLHAEIRKVFRKEPPSPADLDPIYKDISLSLSLKSTVGDQSEDSKKVLELLRALANAIKSERACVAAQIKQMSNKDAQASVFPGYIKELLFELVRYRNAASHKSRVPLNNYEALRTMYALVAIVMWWEEELDLIDWRSDKKSILERIIERASVKPSHSE